MMSTLMKPSEYFLQGGTIKPLVGLLDIHKQAKQKDLLLFVELNNNVTDHVMAGVEEIVGKHGQAYLYVSYFCQLGNGRIRG